MGYQINMATYHACGQCEISFDFCRCEPIKQRNDYTCGPVAIRNACWALGMKIPSVNKITKVSGTDIDGTSVIGLRRGAKAAGLNLKRIYVSSSYDLCSLIGRIGHNNKPLVLGYVVAGEGHYCVILKKRQTVPGMGIKNEFVALNWNKDERIAFDSHSSLIAESPITSEWLMGKLLTFGTEIYIASKGEIK